MFYEVGNIIEFDQSFNERIKDLSKNFPLSFRFLEKDLRHLHAGRAELFKKSIEDLRKIHLLRAKHELRRALFKSLPRKFEAPVAIIDLPKTIAAQKAALSTVNKFDITPIGKALNGKFATMPITNTVAVKPELLLWLEKIAQMDLTEIIHPTSAIAELESEIQGAIAFLKNYLKESEIKFIISNNLNYYIGSVLAEVGRILETPTIEYAHGYTQSELLITVHPLRADYEIVWSDRLRERLEYTFHLIGRPGNILSFGPPFSYNVQRCAGAGVAMLLVPYFEHYDNEGKLETLAKFRVVANELTAAGYELRLRPHPKVKQSPTAMAEVCRLAESLSARISFKKLEEEFKDVSIILGSASSVLFEARVAGVPTVQLVDFNGPDCEADFKLTLSQLPFLRSVVRSSSRNQVRFDEISFKRFISQFCH